jgi:predicted HTH transcriptional regulator
VEKVNRNLIENVTENVTEKQKSTEKSREKSTEKILMLMKNNPHITIRELIELIGIKERAIIKNINKLKAQNRLRREGPDKGGYWVVIDKQIPCKNEVQHAGHDIIKRNDKNLKTKKL